MENNIKPTECRKCYDLESQGAISYRQEQNYVNQHREVKVGLKYLDVRFNNSCNLKCVMCNSSFSNQWVEDERKLINSKNELIRKSIEPKISFYNKNVFKWTNENDVLESIKQNTNTLDRIHFAGGEPLLSKQHYEILEYLIETGKNKELMISYNTNICYIDSKIINLWNQFKSVKVFLSMDGIGEVLEYVRYPIKFDDVTNVFDTIEKHSMPNIRYVIHYTLNALNTHSLPEFIEYKINLPYKSISPNELFSIDCVNDPNYLAINVLPKKLFDSVIDKMKVLQNKYPSYSEQIEKIINRIKPSFLSPASATLQDMFDYCKELDKIRNTNSDNITDIIKTYL